jgi:hypothetical protein
MRPHFPFKVSTGSGIISPVIHVVKGFAPLAHRTPLHIESSVHIGQEPARDSALYPA